MKKILFTLMTLGLLTSLQAQTDQPTPAEQGDTLLAARIIDTYLRTIDFAPLLGDSMLCVESYVVDRSHPEDTMKVYHWYMNNRRVRIEMWQDGMMQEGYYSDGKRLFRRFQNKVRAWQDIAQITFYEYTMPLDVRGALYDWRTKGAEVSYAGRFTLDNKAVHRIFVSSPKMFDRYYFFEVESGLLFMLTEQEHIYGDGKPYKNAQRIDWRAWHEFTPFYGHLVPTIESYQYDQSQIVITHRRYHFEAGQPKLFTEDYHKM